MGEGEVKDAGMALAKDARLSRAVLAALSKQAAGDAGRFAVAAQAATREGDLECAAWAARLAGYLRWRAERLNEIRGGADLPLPTIGEWQRGPKVAQVQQLSWM